MDGRHATGQWVWELVRQFFDLCEKDFVATVNVDQLVGQLLNCNELTNAGFRTNRQRFLLCVDHFVFAASLRNKAVNLLKQHFELFLHHMALIIFVDRFGDHLCQQVHLPPRLEFLRADRAVAVLVHLHNDPL